MVDAVSLSANSYRGASSTLDVRAPAMAAEIRPAVSALAAPQPVTQVSTPSDIAEEIGDLSFLYTSNGLPGISSLPSYAVPPAQAAADERVANGRNPTARLAIESNDLNSLMASFLTARTPSANPAASPDVPADIGNQQVARSAHQSVIAQLYSQF